MRRRDAGRGVSLPAALIGAVVALAGFSIFRSGQRVVEQWSMVSAAYAGCGVAWIMGGAAMIAGGLWVMGSIGRNRIALMAGSVGSVLAGTSLVLGILTYVVPCTGPS